MTSVPWWDWKSSTKPTFLKLIAFIIPFLCFYSFRRREYFESLFLFGTFTLLIYVGIWGDLRLGVYTKLSKNLTKDNLWGLPFFLSPYSLCCIFLILPSPNFLPTRLVYIIDPFSLSYPKFGNRNSFQGSISHTLTLIHEIILGFTIGNHFWSTKVVFYGGNFNHEGKVLASHYAWIWVSCFRSQKSRFLSCDCDH